MDEPQAVEQFGCLVVRMHGQLGYVLPKDGKWVYIIDEMDMCFSDYYETGQEAARACMDDIIKHHDDYVKRMRERAEREAQLYKDNPGLV